MTHVPQWQRVRTAVIGAMAVLIAAWMPAPAGIAAANTALAAAPAASPASRRPAAASSTCSSRKMDASARAERFSAASRQAAGRQVTSFAQGYQLFGDPA